MGPPVRGQASSPQAFKLDRLQAMGYYKIRKWGYMKTIKVYIEGGVCTDVVIPEEFHNKLNYEVIDYDNIEAEEDEKKNVKKRS